MYKHVKGLKLKQNRIDRIVKQGKIKKEQTLPRTSIIRPLGYL